MKSLFAVGLSPREHRIFHMSEFLNYGRSPEPGGDQSVLSPLKLANESFAPLTRATIEPARGPSDGERLTRAIVISTAAGLATYYIARRLPMLPSVLRGTFAMGEAENLLAPSVGQRLKFALFHKPFITGPAAFSAKEVLRRGELAAEQTLTNVLEYESHKMHGPFTQVLESSAKKVAAEGGLTRGLSTLELGASNSTLVPRTLGDRLGKYVSTDIYRSDLLKQRELLKAFPELAGKANQVIADTRALPFKAESFDLVVARHHPPFTVPNPKDMMYSLQETARVLRPNGLFVLDSHRLGYAGQAVRNEVQRLFEVVLRNDAASLVVFKLR